MDEQQVVFEQLTLNNFKRWSYKRLRIFSNYNIITNSNSDNINVPIHVPTCHTAGQCFKLACHRTKERVNFSNIPLPLTSHISTLY